MTSVFRYDTLFQVWLDDPNSEHANCLENVTIQPHSKVEKGHIMTYIWINPVTANLYEPDALNKYLARHGYERFETAGDWMGEVKEKYRQAVANSTSPVMDVRCPKIKALLEEVGVTAEVILPEIDPILIHCAREGSEREDLQGEEKLITTPCKALADMGNGLNLPDTRFVSWKQFVEMLGEEPPRKPLHVSPIPPGFFDDLGIQTVSVTGKEEIRNYLKNKLTSDVQLVEMLICEDGCHHGDGIQWNDELSPGFKEV